MNIFNIVSGICSIASLALAIFVFLKIDKVKSIIEKQTKDYKSQRNKIRDRLNNFKISVLNDTDIESRSELRTELFDIQNKFKKLLKSDCKKKIEKIIIMLKSDTFDKEKLCEDLDYIIARFRSDEL